MPDLLARLYSVLSLGKTEEHTPSMKSKDPFGSWQLVSIECQRSKLVLTSSMENMVKLIS